MGEADPVDRAALKDLLDSVGGDEAFLADLVREYLDDAMLQLSMMDQALDAEQAEPFTRAAHSLRSNSASFGAHSLASLCGQLEALGRMGDLAGARPYLVDARQEFERVRPELQEP